MFNYLLNFLGISNPTDLQYCICLTTCCFVFVQFSWAISRYFTLPLEALLGFKHKR